MKIKCNGYDHPSEKIFTYRFKDINGCGHWRQKCLICRKISKIDQPLVTNEQRAEKLRDQAVVDAVDAAIPADPTTPALTDPEPTGPR